MVALLCEHASMSDFDNLKISVSQYPGTWDDGEPYCNYTFTVTKYRRNYLTIYAGVNVLSNGERVGLDTLYVIDINAHPTNTDLDFETGRKGSYQTGIRFGTTGMLRLLRQILTIVQANFPEVSHISGFRSTGARWKNRDNIANRIANQRITRI